MPDKTSTELLAMPRMQVPADFKQISPDLIDSAANAMNLTMSAILMLIAIIFGALTYKEILAGNIMLLLIFLVFAGLAAAVILGQKDNVRYNQYLTWILKNVPFERQDVFAETREGYRRSDQIVYHFTFDDAYKGTLQARSVSKNDRLLGINDAPVKFHGVRNLKVFRDQVSNLPVAVETDDGYRFWLEGVGTRTQTAYEYIPPSPLPPDSSPPLLPPDNAPKS